MNVGILGCGRTGSRLANELDNRGCGVIVIDCDETTEKNLNPYFSGLFFKGQANDADLLRDAGFDNVDVAVVLTSKDNLNVMTAQLLKNEFEIDRIYVRVLDPVRESVFRGLGISTICPTRFEKDQLFNLITSQEDSIDTINMGGTSIKFVMTSPKKDQIGLTCGEIETPNTEMVFALRKPTGEIKLFYEDLFIEEDDKIIMAITDM